LFYATGAGTDVKELFSVAYVAPPTFFAKIFGFDPNTGLLLLFDIEGFWGSGTLTSSFLDIC